jgi:hypothetical protein
MSVVMKRALFMRLEIPISLAKSLPNFLIKVIHIERAGAKIIFMISKIIVGILKFIVA